MTKARPASQVLHILHVDPAAFVAVRSLLV
jgi:hypothetical protein